MSRFMRYGTLHMSGPLMADKEAPPGPTYPKETAKAAPKKLVLAAKPEIMAGAGPVSGKSKSALKTLISGKPTEKDVREYLKHRVADLMGDSSSDEDA